MADVLIFDDDPSVGDLASEILRVKGLSVSHYLTGAGVVPLALENKPRLIVLDIMMPGMDGLSACRALKSNIATKGVKIVILTAKDYGEDRENALRYGADLFLNKPFDGALFARQVGKLLGYPEPPPGAPPPPAPPLVVTILPGAAVVQTAAFWALLDAGKGLNAFMEKNPVPHPLCWLMMTRYQDAAFSEIAAAQKVLAAKSRLNLAGPDDADASLQQWAPKVCATLPDRSRASPLLFPQREGEFSLAPGARAVTRYTQHPGTCLAYRLEAQSRSLVYCPAHEVPPELEKVNKHEHEKFRDLFEDADLVLHGFRRSLTEDAPRDALGRGAWEPVVDLCARAQAKHLVLLPQAGAHSEGIQWRAEERLHALGSSMRVSVSPYDERVIL